MKKKPETILSVLKKMAKDISAIRAALETRVPADQPAKTAEKPPKNTFPQKTAKEILEECGNSVDGGKLLYSGLNGRYATEDFFTKETCRPISMDFTELLHKGKSWNECMNISMLSDSFSMFNFAEVVYLILESKEFRDQLQGWNYTWTSSHDSGGNLVRVGVFADGGADVGRPHAGLSARRHRCLVLPQLKK